MGLLPLWGMWRAPGSFSEVSHQATTVFSRIWQIHFSRGIFGKIETSFCEENTSDETKEHLSEERWGSFSDICLILISPPISLVFTVVFLYFSGTARRKVEVHSLLAPYSSSIFPFCLLSLLKWELELCLPAHTLLWFIIMGAQGFWVCLVWLKKSVEVERGSH